MTAATVTDWAALHREIADLYDRYGLHDWAADHRQLADAHDAARAVDEAWETYVADALLLVEDDQ